MDLATVLGIVSAVGIMLISIMTGGGLQMFFSIPSILIVGGGTVGATLVNFPLKEVLGVVGVVKNAFLQRVRTTRDVIPYIVKLAQQARKEGLLALESSAKEAPDPLLGKGIKMAVDGYEPQSIEKILATEIDYLRDRHDKGAELFQAMGAYAPAMGLIGTLIGLVQMLQSMDDPSSIGPAMAVALLTTFYGAVMANIFFLPLAGKLRNRSSEEYLVKALMIEGILSITAGDNPRIIEQKLHAFLSPRIREALA